MARKKIGDDVMPVRFPDGTFERIDAIADNRSDFIRGAVLNALGSDKQDFRLDPKILRDGASAKSDVENRPVNNLVSEKEQKSKKPVQPKKNFDRQPVKKDGLRPDAEVLLASIRKRRWTSKQHEKEMGWLGLRFARAEGDLFQAGLIEVDNGVLVAVGGE